MTPRALETLLDMALANAAVATLLAGLAFAVSRLVRHSPVAHFVWLLVLLKLVTPPIVRFPAVTPANLRELSLGLIPRPVEDRAPRIARAVPETADAVPMPEETLAVGSSPALVDARTALILPKDPPALLPPISRARARAPADGARGLPLIPVVLLVWMGGAALLLAVAATRIFRFHRLLRHARPAPAGWVDATRDVAGRLGLRRPPEVLCVAARIPPLVWAPWMRPRLVLPVELLSAMNPEQVTALITHELAHLRRRDHWLRWLELVIVALWWWHPVAWWARRELRRAEEECCDAWVQREFAEKTREYARALMLTVDFLSGSHLALPRTASGLGEARLLRRRFQMILSTRLKHRMSAPLRAVLLIAGVAILSWAPGEAAGTAPAQSDDKEKTGADESVQDAGETPKVPSTPGRRDVEDRLSRLEDQLARLMDEIKILRSALSRSPDAAPKYTTRLDPGSTPEPKKWTLRGRLGKLPEFTLDPKGANHEFLFGGTLFVFKQGEGILEARDESTQKVLWRSQVNAVHSPSLSATADEVTVRDELLQRAITLDVRTGRVIREEHIGREAALAEDLYRSRRNTPRADPEPQPVYRKGDFSRKPQEDLEAEKARLHQRLAEIEAEQAKIRGVDPGTQKPAPTPAKP